MKQSTEYGQMVIGTSALQCEWRIDARIVDFGMQAPSPKPHLIGFREALSLWKKDVLAPHEEPFSCENVKNRPHDDLAVVLTVVFSTLVVIACIVLI